LKVLVRLVLAAGADQPVAARARQAVRVAT
jgi:hypothetical protein